MKYAILGPVEVWHEGAPRRAGGPRERKVLAALLLHTNRVVTMGRLIDAVWGECPPATAKAQIHNSIAALRRNLVTTDGGRIPIARVEAGYVLRIPDDLVDATQFTRLAADADKLAGEGDLSGAARLRREALRLWRGPALGGLGDDPPGGILASEAARLDDQRLTCLERRIEADLALGRHAEVAGELAALAAEYPLRERIVELRMLALYRAGRRQDALAVYAEARQRLADEAGLDPRPDLDQLHHAILRADPSLDQPATVPGPAPTDRPAPAPDSPVPAQLPAAPPEFTGRAGPLADLDGMMPTGDGATGAVVISAIAGAGGVGKTALAVHWAHRMRHRFPDGQLYVDLLGYAPEPPVRPADVLGRFLRALGVAAGQIPTGQDEAAALYRTLLADRRLLVVLDNAADAGHVRPLLPGGPGNLALVTSRDRLAGLIARDGARRVDLDVMSLVEALTLLSRILGENRVAAEPSAAADLVAACAYLPLALRLAAAALAEHPRRRIADHLADLVDDRLGGLEVAGDEQASVRRVFDHSYRVLAPDAQRLFRLLGLHPAADLGVPAIAVLAGTSAAEASDLLATLVTAHLLTQPSPDRYGMHDLIRLYAHETALAEEPESEREAAIGRLLDWYTHVATAAQDVCNPMRTPLARTLTYPPPTPVTFDSDAEAMHWYDREITNLVALTRYAYRTGRYGTTWQLADVQFSYFVRRHEVGRFIENSTLGVKAAEADGNAMAECALANSLGVAYSLSRQLPEALTWYTRSLTISQALGMRERQPSTWGNIGAIHSELGQHELAESDLRTGLEIAREIGNRAVESMLLGNLGYAYQQMRDWPAAVATLREALALQRETGNRHGECLTETNLGAAYLELGDHAAAITHMTAGLTIAEELGDRLSMAGNLLGLGDAHEVLGDSAAARRNWGTALSIFTEIGSPEADRARARFERRGS